MGRLYVLLFFLQVAVAAAALISCLSTEESEINALPRIAWILIILFFPLIGSIAWFVAGRGTARPRTTRRVGGGFPERDRPRAPDDDPEFLRSLRARLDSDPVPPRGPETTDGEADDTPAPDPDEDPPHR